MPPDYENPIELTHDAVAFAESRFGAHYLARLEKAKQRCTAAMDGRYSDSERAHAATKAATIDQELDYFRTAQKVKQDPKLIDRLRQKLNKKKKPPIDQV